MRRSLQWSWGSYVVAAAAVVLALGVRAALDPWLGNTGRTVTLHAAIAYAAWTGGFWPGIFAAVLGYLGAEYFFIEPRGTFGLFFRDAGLLAGYSISAVVISLLGGAIQAGRRRAGAAAAQIESSEERFRTFMDHSPVSVFLKDEEGRYVFINRAGERLLDVTREQWLGKTDAELIPQETARIVQGRDREVLASDRPLVYPLTFPTATGERELHSTKFPLRDSQGRRYVGSVTVDLTELKRSQSELQIVTDTIPVAVARNSKDLRYLWVNRAYARWLEKNPQDIAGRPMTEVLGESGMQRIRPYIERVLRGEQVRYEAAVQFKGIGWRWIDAVYTPTFDAAGKPDGWVAVVTDIEERKHSEEALRAAQQQLQLVTDSMPAAVIHCDREERYRWVNPIYAQWIGREPSDILGRHVSEVVGEEQLRAIRPYIDRVLAGEHVQYERLADLQGFGKRWLSVLYTPTFDASGELSGWVAVASDIHERKQMEEALREADRRKDDFLATLAHELRNPLAPIRNAVAILQRKGKLDPEIEFTRDVISRQADQMARIIDDLLDIERISRGRLLLRKERVPLERVMDLALETSQPAINARRQRLSVVMPAERLALDADPVRLAQVFANLLNNAAKYTEPQGEIRVSATLEGAEIVVSIEDTGIGFAPEAASNLFKPFSQLTDVRERAAGGLGIGLSLVQGIVELHGGLVQARSKGPGQGAEFIVRLPVAAAPVAPQREQPPSRDTPAPPAGLKVLVADDNRDAADSLQRILAIYGYDVRVAYDGKTALETTAAFKPSVAVLDIGMPGANGYDVARELRRQEGSAITLIALTGYGQEGDRKRALDAGFDYHVTKPVDPGALNDLLVDVASR